MKLAELEHQPLETLEALECLALVYRPWAKPGALEYLALAYRPLAKLEALGCQLLVKLGALECLA